MMPSSIAKVPGAPRRVWSVDVSSMRTGANHEARRRAGSSASRSSAQTQFCGALFRIQASMIVLCAVETFVLCGPHVLIWSVGFGCMKRHKKLRSRPVIPPALLTRRYPAPSTSLVGSSHVMVMLNSCA